MHIKSAPFVLRLLPLISLCAASPFVTVSVVSVLGHPRHSISLPPGYIPSAFLDKPLRFAFSDNPNPEKKGIWDHECLEAAAGDAANGKLVMLTDNCGWGQRDAAWKWDAEGRVIHSSGADRCLDLADQPETLLDAPDLGPLNLVQFYTCDGTKNQQWVVLRDSHKLTSVAKPNLCLSIVGEKDKIVAAVECREARDIGVTPISQS